MAWYSRLSRGMARTRESFSERLNILFRRGANLDDEFYDDLEETLIMSDMGARASDEIVERVRDTARRKALPDADAIMDLLAQSIEDLFVEPEVNPLTANPSIVLFVGVNGTGKTTTVGKLAYAAARDGRNVLIGSADTFRAAAIEQLDVWAQRAGVEVVERERGADPASVCYDVVERAEELGSDLVLIDTSGRLHTSQDLMRELEKCVKVTRKRANIPVYTVLVIDATTGQNGLQQAREFDKALNLDGVIMTKLDGTAKGGIAMAVSHECNLPILCIGVGEKIGDFRPFNSDEFVNAILGRGELAEAEEARQQMLFAQQQEAEAASEQTGAEPEAEQEAEASGEQAAEPEAALASDVSMTDAQQEQDEVTYDEKGRKVVKSTVNEGVTLTELGIDDDDDDDPLWGWF